MEQIRTRKYHSRKIIPMICALSAAVSICAQSSHAMFSSSYMDTGNIEISINTIDSLRAISPYIYGINSEAGINGVTVNAVRQSDPKVSSYNWETNYSNAGSGNGSENGTYLVDSYPQEMQEVSALYTENLVARATRYNIPSKYVTLQMMGKVAPDSADKPWETVMFRKNDGYLSSPDKNDGIVYMDEYVSCLANRYGYAIDGGINGYFLDNEPENWSVRFPAAVHSPITSEELLNRSAELAYTVKEIDPTALTYGPSVNGIEAFVNINNPTDWEKYRSEYSWFIDYYLDGMKKASDEKGTRLLDVLDVHYHTEATNGLLQPIIDSTDEISNNARLQATRILWDSSYTENSTTAIKHNQYIPLIPTLNASIDMYYPGTKLSFSEYDFGGGNNVSGGIAAADALGIFAYYGVHMACMKPSSADIPYLRSAINIYTDYDGQGSCFGNTLVRSNNGGDDMSSVYSSINDDDDALLKVLIINKNRFNPKAAEISITSGAEYSYAEVYSFNEESSDIIRAEDITDIENNHLTFEMEPLSVYMLVFSGDNDEILDESTVSGQITSSGTETTVSGENNVSGTDTTVSAKDTVTSVSIVPEHVDASTYSSAGTTASSVYSENTQSSSATELPEISVNEVSDTYTETTPVNASVDDETEKTVPPVIKAIVLLLVAAVVIVFLYVIISDIIMTKRSGK